MAVLINASTSSGLQLTPDTSGAIAFQNNDTTAATIDSSGNVGIGTTSSSYRLTVAANATNNKIVLQNTNTAASVSKNNAIQFNGTDTVGSVKETGDIFVTAADNNYVSSNMLFYLRKSDAIYEAMRIDSTGNLLVGTLSALVSNTHSFINSGSTVTTLRNSGATAGLYWQVGPDSANSYKIWNASNAGVYLLNGGTSWSSTSDENLKNITGTIQNGLEKISSLRAAEFTWKADETNKPQVGLIAQDVQKVLPEVIDNGPNGYLGVRYSEIIPLLVAALQEANAKIDALTARVEALEAK